MRTQPDPALVGFEHLVSETEIVGIPHPDEGPGPGIERIQVIPDTGQQLAGTQLAQGMDITGIVFLRRFEKDQAPFPGRLDFTQAPAGDSRPQMLSVIYQRPDQAVPHVGFILGGDPYPNMGSVRSIFIDRHGFRADEDPGGPFIQLNRLNQRTMAAVLEQTARTGIIHEYPLSVRTDPGSPAAVAADGTDAGTNAHIPVCPDIEGNRLESKPVHGIKPLTCPDPDHVARINIDGNDIIQGYCPEPDPVKTTYSLVRSEPKESVPVLQAAIHPAGGKPFFHAETDRLQIPSPRGIRKEQPCRAEHR